MKRQISRDQGQKRCGSKYAIPSHIWALYISEINSMDEWNRQSYFKVWSQKVFVTWNAALCCCACAGPGEVGGLYFPTELTILETRDWSNSSQCMIKSPAEAHSREKRYQNPSICDMIFSSCLLQKSFSRWRQQQKKTHPFEDLTVDHCVYCASEVLGRSKLTKVFFCRWQGGITILGPIRPGLFFLIFPDCKEVFVVFFSMRPQDAQSFQCVARQNIKERVPISTSYLSATRLYWLMMICQALKSFGFFCSSSCFLSHFQIAFQFPDFHNVATTFSWRSSCLSRFSTHVGKPVCPFFWWWRRTTVLTLIHASMYAELVAGGVRKEPVHQHRILTESLHFD